MIDLKKIELKEAGFFRFKELNGKVLLTNDVGDFAFVTQEDFQRFVYGELSSEDSVYQELSAKNFMKGNGSVTQMAHKFRSKNIFLGAGPVLHILIATLRCNLRCIYCHASATSPKEKGYDMDKQTAKKAVDTILSAPARHLTIEFQGGEPLLNWEVVKFVVEYARERERIQGKEVNLLLVSNFISLNDEKLAFLVKNRVGLCTSLDGPASLHNKNRGGYQKVVKNIKKAMHLYKLELPARLPSAIVTVSRHSLAYPREIVDEYVNLGFEGVFVRPLNHIGYARDVQKDIGYSIEEYIDFYRNFLDYTLQVNKETGQLFFDQTALIFLIKILTDSDPNFMDIRSPCGAGIGQIAYNYNGDVYTCDEGRMLSRMEDESFRIGNVMQNSYQELLDNAVVKACCVASCLDGIPLCSQCVYKPYCGTCPVLNYVESGDIFLKSLNNNKCKLNMGILDILFEKIQKKGNMDIFERWINKKRR